MSAHKAQLVNGVVPVGSFCSSLEVLNIQGHEDTQCKPEKPSGESEVGVKKKNSPWEGSKAALEVQLLAPLRGNGRRNIGT